MCLDDVKSRQCFPLLVEHSHVTKIVLHGILENASICHLPRNTEASCYRATSVTFSLVICCWSNIMSTGSV